MQPHTNRVNPSEETIRIGPLGIRFLLTGDDSNGSVSVFEVLVPVGQKLAAPAHRNDAYEEILYGIEGVLTWTVDGTPIDVGAPLRQPRQRGCETARRHNPCDHGPRVLP
jgi:quercetin dioxygenase-like cupin family protein